MSKKGFEQLIVVLLFILVMIVFSFAEKDSRKLDRLYNTTQLVQKKNAMHTVQVSPVVEQPFTH